MTSVAISALVFVCVFGGALLGLALQGLLPARHFSAHSKDLVRLATGLIATMAALVLGLLIASAKTSYDTQSAEFMQVSAKLVLLDRTLGHYGSEATPAREFLRRLVAALLERIGDARSSQPVPFAPTASAEHMYDVLHKLVPQTEAQRTARTEALGITRDISLARWLLFAQQHGSIPMPFLVLLVFWVTIIFLSFGLFAPANATVIATLFLCALSVSGAIYLILELDRPFAGLLQLSDGPLRNAIAHLGR